ncbi:hypothetical protein [Erysipelothrix anatis]|uniref:hypothetical protein n=1 Tax=Erysipelothrix anatis TaxID=2683713 RepID=UPI00135AFCC6|nr:hypothetical protein [Erysipelothrix anatis]
MKKKIMCIVAVAMLVLAGCTSKNIGYAIAESMNTEDLETILRNSSVTPNVGILDTDSLKDVYEELAFELDMFQDELQLLDPEDMEALDGELLIDVFSSLGDYTDHVIHLMDLDPSFKAFYLGDDRDMDAIYGISVFIFSEAISFDNDLIDFMNELAKEEIGEAVFVKDNVMVIAESDYITDVDQFLTLAEKAVTKHLKS